MPLAASSLAFAFPAGRSVFRDLSAAFAPGQVTALVGPNGCGKSTLLRLLLGALNPGAGAVDRTGLAPAAYIAQRPEVAAPLTVRQVVALGRYARPTDHPAVDRALAAADLADRAGDLFAHLSAGGQQRAALARALAQVAPASSASLLLADEPTSALDPRHALAAMESLRALAAAGATVVVSLHDLSAALRHADRALVLDAGGRLLAHAPVGEALDPATLALAFGVRFELLRGAGAAALAPVGASAAPEAARSATLTA